MTLAFLTLLATALAADYTLVGSLIFGRHNDRSPKPSTHLTPLGATAQYQIGQFYRSRYFDLDNSSESTRIKSLNQYGFFEDGDVYAEAADSSVILYSHQSFLQGLYPPMEYVQPQYSKLANESLAWESNGTLSEYPLNGFQYVKSAIQENATEGYIWTQGDANCPALTSALKNVISGFLEFQETSKSLQPFYDSLIEIPFIAEQFEPSELNFKNLMSIYDEVNVNIIHNATVASQFNSSAVSQIKAYAEAYQWYISDKNINQNLTIGAKSLIGHIVSKLNVTKTTGSPGINYFTGAYSVMYQLALIIGLDSASSAFRTMPNYGATYVFELLNNTSNETFVRFSFMNGTSDVNLLRAYPLFNGTETMIPWAEFVENMNKAGAIHSVQEWCTQCGWNRPMSEEVIAMCAPYTDDYQLAQTLASKGVDFRSLSEGDFSSLGVKSQTLTLVQAGAIGACVTLFICALAGGLGFLFIRKGLKRADIFDTTTSSGRSSNVSKV